MNLLSGEGQHEPAARRLDRIARRIRGRGSARTWDQRTAARTVSSRCFPARGAFPSRGTAGRVRSDACGAAGERGSAGGGRGGGQAVQDQGHVAPPAALGRIHGPQHAHEHAHDPLQVVGYEILADHSGLLAPGHQRVERVEETGAGLRREDPGIPCGREYVVLVRRRRQGGFDHGGQSAARILVVEGAVDDGEDLLVELLVQHRPQEGRLVREPAEERRDPHARPPGDLVERRVGSLLGVDVACRSHDLLCVAQGVGAQWPGGIGGHNPSLTTDSRPLVRVDTPRAMK